MRKLHALALAAAASFATFAQAAPPATANGPAGAAIPVPGVPFARYRMDTEGFNDYKGTYVLSNGKYMVVSNRGRRFFAEVDGERRAELIPVGRNVFIAREAGTIMMFDKVYKGRVNNVVIRPSHQVG